VHPGKHDLVLLRGYERIWYVLEGLFEGADDRDADLVSVRSLVALIRQHVLAGGEVQLYPVCDGQEHRPPKGTIQLSLASLDPDTFFFNEHFLYRVTQGTT
jgi:hypothetical protein